MMPNIGGEAHPLGGRLLIGVWRCPFGSFLMDEDRWQVDPGGPVLSVLHEVAATDVSISCDVDLPPAKATVPLRSSMPVGAAA